MADSTHRVEVVPVVLEKHSNADSLSIVHVEGYQAIVRTQDWEPAEGHATTWHKTGKDSGVWCRAGAYIPPDSLVPVDRPEFAFLKDPNKPDQKTARVKAKKLRGEWSMGLLIPAPEGTEVGDDVAERLGVTHYEPPLPLASTGGLSESPPKYLRVIRKDGKHDALPFGFDFPKYDVEAFRKYGKHVFEPGEPVHVTEKIHGTNARFLHDGKRYYCGTHTRWIRSETDPATGAEKNLWWRALGSCAALTNFLYWNPGVCVYAEVYGQVQDLKYGTGRDELRVAVFDLLHEGRWVDAANVKALQLNPNGPGAWTLPWVPNLGELDFDFDRLLQLAEGPSLIEGADHLREGIVVKPMFERWHSKCGRVNLKIVSNEYLSRAA